MARTSDAVDALDADPGSESHAFNEPKVGAQGSGLVDELGALGSDPGPNRMQLMNPKVGPQGQDFRFISCIRWIRWIRLQRHLHPGVGV